MIYGVLLVRVRARVRGRGPSRWRGALSRVFGICACRVSRAVAAAAEHEAVRSWRARVAWVARLATHNPATQPHQRTNASRGVRGRIRTRSVHTHHTRETSSSYDDDDVSSPSDHHPPCMRACARAPTPPSEAMPRAWRARQDPCHPNSALCSLSLPKGERIERERERWIEKEAALKRTCSRGMTTGAQHAFKDSMIH